MPRQQLDIIAANQPHLRPEFYRLPVPGAQDPFFGLTRAHYYELEKRRTIKLVRVIPKGKKKGIVLVRYADMSGLMNTLAVKQQGKGGQQ
jgi:hypothetical protein